MIIDNSTDHLKRHAKATGTFYFKQFKVEDGLSTMKVGTDAVLLGAAVDVADADHILEIGAGCGVISLILAQRSSARIEAIDIDERSVMQAAENVKQSPWNDRISVFNQSLQKYADQTNERYDLVVSNPPFFSRSLKSPHEKRNISRHNSSLSFDELLKDSARLMLPDASLWIILPVKESAEFMNEAIRPGFYPHFIMKIFPKTGQRHHRNIIQFKRSPAGIIKEKILVIRDCNNSYTLDYKALTKEFYLDF